ncbi:flagellar protein FlaG [Oxalobacter sp. OttesenSCG-928-P03]|nr:flagellar protein FlaG [Oxalobacter sp. OttesenSCG-928-P03]
MEIRTISNAMPASGIRPLADNGPVLQPVESVEQVTAQAVTRPSETETPSAARKAAGTEEVPQRTNGKVNVQEEAAPASQAQTKEAMKDVVASLQSLSRTSGLQFAIDDELGRVVVKVIDSETDEVIKQFPSEDALRLARTLGKPGGGLVEEKA